MIPKRNPGVHVVHMPHFTNILCHSTFVKFKFAQDLKEESAIRKFLELSGNDQEGLSVGKGGAS